MRRSFMNRAFGLLTALLYLAMPGGLLASRACAHHDGPAAALADNAGAQSHNAHAHGSTTESDASESGAGCHDCTCISVCSTSSVVALGTFATILVATAAPIPAVTPVVEVEQPRPLLEPFILPYAHAPPQSIA